jgi:hypothetical protein
MKKQTRAKATRIMEIVLVLFIVSVGFRAIPNLNVLHRDSPEIDDRYWGNYARVEFMATHPPASAKARTSKVVPERKSPKMFPVLPGKYWLWRRDFRV